MWLMIHWLVWNVNLGSCPPLMDKAALLRPVTSPTVECAIRTLIILYVTYVNKATMPTHSTNVLRLSPICPLPPVMFIIVSTAMRRIIVVIVCRSGFSSMVSAKPVNFVRSIVRGVPIQLNVFNASQGIRVFRVNANLPVMYSIANHVLTQPAVDSAMILSSCLITEISADAHKHTT